MPDRIKWTRQQLLIAFALYCEMPFGKLHSRNPQIIHYAKLIGRTPDALAMKLTNIASLDPAITQSGRKGLRGASAADRKMWGEMQADWQQFAVESRRALNALDGTEISSHPVERHEDADYTGLSKKAVVEIRIGQRFFRKAVLSAYQTRCCISGLNIPELLIASHIVPWRNDPHNRLNPRNGLCLSTLHDKAFDLGLITISEKLTVQVSDKLVRNKAPFLQSCLLDYAGQRIKLPKKFQPDDSFLEYHRRNIFQSL